MPAAVAAVFGFLDDDDDDDDVELGPVGPPRQRTA